MDPSGFREGGGAGLAARAIGSVARAQTPPTFAGGTAKPTGPVTSKLAQHPDMKYRPLGETGEVLSLIGCGGFHLAKPGGPTAAEAVDIVHAAIASGITFFDNCWDYNGGESEVRLGKAPGRAATATGFSS